MTWAKWVLLAWYLVCAVIMVSWIGKPRKPITPADAAIALVMYFGLVALVLVA